VIFHAFDSGFSRAERTAEKVFLRLDAVTDYLAPAVCTDGREFMNRAFETIENVLVARRDNFKRQIIIISANFTLCHIFFSSNVILKSNSPLLEIVFCNKTLLNFICKLKDAMTMPEGISVKF
jgi:hypothetical protein